LTLGQGWVFTSLRSEGALRLLTPEEPPFPDQAIHFKRGFLMRDIAFVFFLAAVLCVTGGMF
jgi:hypothetical protein